MLIIQKCIRNIFALVINIKYYKLQDIFLKH